MGDIIRKITDIKLGGSAFEIELNRSTRGHGLYDIHLQNKNFRLEMPEDEFLQMASCILLAKRQLDVIKGIATDD